VTDMRELQELAQRFSFATGSEVHFEYDAEGRIFRLWHCGCYRSPLEFAEFARRLLAR
jgi:hypothetical protein